MNDTPLTPPIALCKPTLYTIHNDARQDDYAWLQTRDDPETENYLAAENNYTDQCSKEINPLRQALYDEITARLVLDDNTVPWRIGRNFYYYRYETEQQYPLFCCKHDSLDNEEILLLDENQLAAGHDFLDTGCHVISPDQRYLAYTVDTLGDEIYDLNILDTQTMHIVDDKVCAIAGEICFAPDSQSVFYVKQDDKQRPFAVYRHQIGTQQQDDTLIYQEANEHFWVDVSLSKSQQFVFIHSNSKTTTEVRYLHGTDMTSAHVLLARRGEIEYSVEHHGQFFYMRINDSGDNFRLLRMSIKSPSLASSDELLAHDPLITLEDFDVFADYLVVLERKQASLSFRVLHIVTNASYSIDCDEACYSIDFGDNVDPQSNCLRYEYCSLTTPDTVFDFCLQSKTRTLRKQDRVLGDFSSMDYAAKRCYATSTDGVQVPISLVYKKACFKQGKNPLYLTGYGAYGTSYDPWFSCSRLSLLDRGFVFAIAHIRGGGECGKKWHLDGKCHNKPHSFSDFIACTQALLEQGYADPAQVVISGGSAGGLLMGAVVNQAPQLYRAVITEVPFVDTLNTMLNDELPLTITEYDEWGNPLDNQDDYKVIKAYSPYDNVKHQPYPDMLITCSLHDTRVPYWEAVKWAAKLRAHATNNNHILVKIEMSTGHSGVSGRFAAINETAFQYAFILNRLGLA